MAFGSTFGSNTNSGFGQTSGSFGSNTTGNSGFGGFGSTSNSASTGFNSGFNSGKSVNVNPSNHYMIPESDSPTDSVQALEWSPVADVLLAGSWDGCVRCYQVTGGGYQSPSHSLKANLNFMPQGPAQGLKIPMDVAFHPDGNGFFTACSDGKAYWTDFNSIQGQNSNFGGASANTNQMQVCGSHNGIVNTVHWLKEPSILATSGSDSTIKFWDVRTSMNNQNAQPARVINLPNRSIAMDIMFPVCVTLTADRGLHIFDLSNSNNQPIRSQKGTDAPLKKQFRSVKISPDKTHFIMGSIEGRVSIQFVSQNDQSKNFSFQCHRDKEKKLCYPINRLAFHPKYLTFATCGGDGKVVFWDKDSRMRLEEGKQSVAGQEPLNITAGAFSANGDKFAYSVGYDWSKGLQGRNNLGANAKTAILIHTQVETAAKPKNK